MLICDRCGTKYNPEDPGGCSAVPPSEQQRHHFHKHKWDLGTCLQCGQPDDRMTFG